MDSVRKNRFFVKDNCVVEASGVIGSSFVVEHDEDAVFLVSDDRGIEIRIDIGVAKRHAEVAWAKFINSAPVVAIGGCGGKTLVPRYIKSYVAANNLAIAAGLKPCIADQTDIAAELLLKAVQRVLSTAAECHRSRAPLDLALKIALDNLSIVDSWRAD